MKNNPLLVWLIGVIAIALSLFVLIFIMGSELNKKETRINDLEKLVEYHQNQTFELVEELHDLKKESEK